MLAWFPSTGELILLAVAMLLLLPAAGVAVACFYLGRYSARKEKGK